MSWTAVKDADLLLALLLELAVYASACYWGFTRGSTRLIKVLAGLGAPAVFIVVWGGFGAPTASHPLHGLARVALEICWYGGGAAALAASRGRRAASVFVALYLLSTAVQHL
ncbi:hypothetical protein GCM10023194_38020 [Planotetraspora phitsanulokensis]|uniref:DUF2568 domain-containing protein n=1 Tax=Planotetraspora phitsanulokensis TaxID=575192 RepID=A0A8J3UM47_9ACTN|nr:YrdB family protein [Planotetraspora phitsanulokensis]GII41235.1 hypothetical protein Pph01_62380 [Planotetraspora phitsanulokensis]